ncbi:tyrosine-type recombinase/integrase [Prauserella flavalba]|uniref:tyrosine-type recombinase/integrase n=1 Tax=Prauserella flavalba TaxID=1477506 RepID=UPI0036E7FE99
MARPPTPVGTYGAIRTERIATKTWEATARFRMADGRLKRVGRTGLSDVDHHIVRVKGVGLVRVAKRKGKRAGLTLQVPEWSVPMLRRRKLASGGGPLFPSANGEWLDPSNVIHRIQEAFAAVGYGWVTSHVFRKTVATVLDEADLPTSAIADQLGNTPAVVEKHYRRKRVVNDGNVAALEGMLPAEPDDPGRD